MKVYIGADHRGYSVKEKIKAVFSSIEFVDMGAFAYDPRDDFVDFAREVGSKVSSDITSRGILICGSGVGMCIAANKIPGIRCCVGHSTDEVKASRHDDDINVLALSADYLDEGKMTEIVNEFLTADFLPEERFVRRIAKMKELEQHA